MAQQRTAFDDAILAGRNHGDVRPGVPIGADPDDLCYDGRPRHGRWNTPLGFERAPRTIPEVQAADARTLVQPSWLVPASWTELGGLGEAEYEIAARVAGLLASAFGHLANAAKHDALDPDAAEQFRRCARAAFNRLPTWARTPTPTHAVCGE